MPKAYVSESVLGRQKRFRNISIRKLIKCVLFLPRSVSAPFPEQSVQESESNSRTTRAGHSGKKHDHNRGWKGFVLFHVLLGTDRQHILQTVLICITFKIFKPLSNNWFCVSFLSTISSALKDCASSFSALFTQQAQYGCMKQSRFRFWVAEKLLRQRGQRLRRQVCVLLVQCLAN